MDIFHLSKRFPPEERYSLTDQIRRSSRSVPANIADCQISDFGLLENGSTRPIAAVDRFEKEILRHLFKNVLFSNCDYRKLTDSREAAGKMLGNMILRPEKFLPR